MEQTFKDLKTTLQKFEDLHRNIIKGGIYLYPTTKKNPQGKLRLLYECNPMAMIMENAGGKAHNGNQKILDITPTELHQRCAFYAGSANMMSELEQFIDEGIS